MTLKITIRMDNAAFEDDPMEVKSILERFTHFVSIGLWRLATGRVGELTPKDGPIMDSNGNTVGEWSVTL